MGDKTGIAWADATWNPIRGCTRVSEGCRHCYAEQEAARWLGPEDSPYRDVVKRVPGPSREAGYQGRWTGEVIEIPHLLAMPLGWTRPRWIFVNSMSDLFHEKLATAAIDRVFAVMAIAPRHRFIVLTKRAARMAEYSRGAGVVGRVRELAAMMVASETNRRHQPRLPAPFPWPLPNVVLGVSCEDQATADERIPHLLRADAAVRWVSAEPLLGPIRFDRIAFGPAGDDREPELMKWMDPLRGTTELWNEARRGGWGGVAPAKLDWVIVGGESGPLARPYFIHDGLAILAACREAGVAAFHKQLGSDPIHLGLPWKVKHQKGGDPAEWPLSWRVQEWPAMPELEAIAGL